MIYIDYIPGRRAFLLWDGPLHRVDDFWLNLGEEYIQIHRAPGEENWTDDSGRWEIEWRLGEDLLFTDNDGEYPAVTIEGFSPEETPQPYDLGFVVGSPREISIPKSYGAGVPSPEPGFQPVKVYLTTDDIADDLVTDSADKVLSAAQGVALSQALAGKADTDSVYTRQEVDSALSRYETRGEAAATEDALQTAIGQKQDNIADLDSIRSGSQAGATAYQKPSSGIPASDIAPGVIPERYAGSPTAGGFASKAVAIPFGVVTSDSTATDIKARVDNFPDTLADGVCAYIRNDVIASASGWTLDINGTGARPVYASNANATRVTTLFSAAVTYLFVYNSARVSGGCWDMYYGYNANDNTIGYNLRTNTMSLPVSGACYRYRLLFTSADGEHFVPANTATSTNATAKRATNQTPIDPFGSIRYYSYTTAVSSGSRPGATYLWEQYVLTLGYSFNRTGAALELEAWKPVYIKCHPQSDGSAIIDAEDPFTQSLPAAADGLIYIHLGVATAATTMEMVFHHPVYYIDGNGRRRIWTGEDISV